MIRKLIDSDREKIKRILESTDNFNENEINIAIELINIYINDENQKDYQIFVDEEENVIRGYVCIGPRPLTTGTFDLYWIAVNPEVQSKGIGSSLIKYIENHIKEGQGRLILIETSGKPSYEKERKFYEKNMYSEIVNIRDFYDKGDSLVIYGKYLD